MPTNFSIRLINHCNPYRHQPIANIICRGKVALLSGRLTRLDQVGNLTIKQSNCDRISTPVRQRLACFKDASSWQGSVSVVLAI